LEYFDILDYQMPMLGTHRAFGKVARSVLRRACFVVNQSLVLPSQTFVGEKSQLSPRRQKTLPAIL